VRQSSAAVKSETAVPLGSWTVRSRDMLLLLARLVSPSIINLHPDKAALLCGDGEAEGVKARHVLV
jgi:hypothetical protein